nr:E3 SUMO-protein ligase ZBED1-like [Misgurnus anguillicaudatus]
MSTAGRKRREDLWAHFTFDDEQNKTKCKACGAVIRGKNTTNLKRHLQMSHPDIFSKLQKYPDEGGAPSAKKAKISHQNIAEALLGTTKYKSNDKEQQVKEEAIAKWIGRSGLPLTTVEDEDFILMIETFDKKLTVPKKTKISNLSEKHYEDEMTKFKKRLCGARKVSIGIDLWTKKGLSASFLGISCCFFVLIKTVQNTSCSLLNKLPIHTLPNPLRPACHGLARPFGTRLRSECIWQDHDSTMFCVGKCEVILCVWLPRVPSVLSLSWSCKTFG